MRIQTTAIKTISSITFLSLIFFSTIIPECIAQSISGCDKKIVSGYAKDVGLKKNDSVVIKTTVPQGKIFILTDIVADRTFGTFSFNISNKISLSTNVKGINIKEYSIDKSPSWHFYSGIPFKGGSQIVINKMEGSGNVFISGYLIDE